MEKKSRNFNTIKPKTRFQSNGMQVLKIRKSKNISLNMQMPLDIRKENTTDDRKENNVRPGSFTSQKSQRRSVDKNDDTKKQSRKERQALIDKEFDGLEEKSLVQIRRTRDKVATSSSPTKFLKKNNVANPRTANAVMNWFDTKSDGLTAANPESILLVLRDGLDRQKKKYDRLVILANKKRQQIKEADIELQKVELLSNKGQEKQNLLLKKVADLEINVKKSVTVADDAEKYNYVQRLMANRAKKPADMMKTDVTKLQKEINMVEKEIKANTKLAHRRRSSAIKIVGKADALEKQLNDIRKIYATKRREVLNAKNGTKRLQNRLKIRNEARDQLIRFLNGDHGEEEEQKLLDDVMKGEMKMKELEERQKALVESGKAIEEAFFNMQQLSRANTLDECVHNFIHREDKYNKMLKQEKRMLHLIDVLKKENKILKAEDAKVQFALDNMDVKRDMMINREKLEEESIQIDSKIDLVNKHSNELYMQLQFTSQCLMSISKLLGEISPRLTKQKSILDTSFRLQQKQLQIYTSFDLNQSTNVKNENNVVEANSDNPEALNNAKDVGAEDGVDNSNQKSSNNNNSQCEPSSAESLNKIIEDSNTKFPFPPSPINTKDKKKKLSFGRSRTTVARRRSSNDIVNGIGNDVKPSSSGNKEPRRKGSLSGRLQSSSNNPNKISSPPVENENVGLVPRPPQSQPNALRNPSKKTKKTKQRLNPIKIDKFDGEAYNNYIKDIVRKLNTFLTKDLLESKKDSFSSIAGSLYDAMKEQEGAVVPARPGNIRVASLHPKRRRGGLKNVYDIQAAAAIIENLGEPQSPILNDSVFDTGNINGGDEENMEIETTRRTRKITTYHVLKAQNHHLAALHFHHTGLSGSNHRGKTPSPSRGSKQRSTKKSGTKSRTSSIDSEKDEGNKITFGGFRQSAGIMELLSETPSKKKPRRSTTIKKKRYTGVNNKGNTFVTQLPPPGYRTGNSTPGRKKKKSSRKRQTAYKHINAVNKNMSPLRRQSSRL